MYMPYCFQEGILAENVLMFLKKFEGLPFTIRELCLFVKRTKPAVWKVLRRLQQKGLIELKKEGRKYRGKVARQKRYYQVPSYYVSELLTPEERYVYCYLQSLSGRRKIRISMRETAKRLRISRNTLSRVLRNLERKFVLNCSMTRRGTEISFFYYQQTARVNRGKVEVDGEILPTRHFNLKEVIRDRRDEKKVEVAGTVYSFPQVSDSFLMEMVKEGKISLLGARYFDYYASYVYYLALGWAEAVTELISRNPARAPSRLSEVGNVKYLIALVDKLSQMLAPHDLRRVDIMALVFSARRYFLSNPVEWSYLASGFFRKAAEEIFRSAVVKTASKRDLPVYTEVGLSGRGEVVFKEKRGPFVERETEYPGMTDRIVIGDPERERISAAAVDRETRDLCYLSAKVLNQISEITREIPLDRDYTRGIAMVVIKAYREVDDLNRSIESALLEIEKIKQTMEESPVLACYSELSLKEAEEKLQKLLELREEAKKKLAEVVRETNRWLEKRRKKLERKKKELEEKRKSRKSGNLVES